MNGNETFWRGWLVVVTLGVMLFGLSMVLVPGLIRQFFGMLVFSSPGSLDAFDDRAIAYITLVHGVLGTVMFGWCIALLCIILGPFRRCSFEAWLTVTISLGAWFVPDTLFSLWTHFWQNAVLNGALIVLFAVPLAATYRSHREGFARSPATAGFGERGS